MPKFQKPDNSNERTYEKKPPQIEEELILVLRRYGSKSNKPKMFPGAYLDQANYWIGKQETMKEHEEAHWQPGGTKTEPNAGYWITPYIDRVRSSLHQFLIFGDPEQAFIIHHIEQGVQYRGDTIGMYKSIIENTKIMGEYIDKYGRTEDGLLPENYTKMVMNQVRKVVDKWDAELPYDKNEREQ